MSFIVKGIDLPDKEDVICLEIYSDGNVWDKSNWEPHPPKVSAIQIPKDHGDIKDVSGIINYLEDTIREEGLDPWCEVNAVIELVADAPTILETEK